MTTTAEQSLEKIYSFEVLDTKTLRKMAPQGTQKAEEKAEKKRVEVCAPDFCEFEFAKVYTAKMASLRLLEPIESLGLAPFTLKSLAKMGLKNIGELVEALIGLKNHQDEIRDKICAFVGKDPLARKASIDFESLVRTLFFPLDPQARYFFLERYGLGTLFPLKPNELYEVEKWGQETKDKMGAYVRKELEKEASALFLRHTLTAIVNTFLKTWLIPRAGFALRADLEERLFMVSEQSAAHTKKVLGLLTDICGCIFDHGLVKVEQNIYAHNASIAEKYHSVIHHAKSYFYAPRTSYPIEKLALYLAQDFARLWCDISEDFIEKVLRCSADFVISRGQTGKIIVEHNPNHLC